MKISICIPTYNRASHLADCLNSIITCRLNSLLEFQVCISDNHSTDNTYEVVKNVQSKLNIKYHRNETNLGRVRNYLNVVNMADGEFVWLFGDDDLLLPYAINSLSKLIDAHPRVDFFYVNSFHLASDFLTNFPKPFDISNLPSDMKPFSSWECSGELPFLELIDPKVSFDFLGGMFLSVFRKENWLLNINILNEHAINDSRTFSHFDNTFPHLKIFAKAFSKSVAYFNVHPLNVCLSGSREWEPMNSLVMSVRLVEALKEYRRNGMSFWAYVYCKNFALRNVFSDFLKMWLYKKKSGYEYVNILKLSLEYSLYPNLYLSLFYFTGRQLRKFFHEIS